MNQDWKVASLINLCDEITDGSHFSPKSKVADEYPYITVRDLTDGVIDFNSCKFIDSDAYTSLVKNGCQPNNGDILFSKDGTVGKVALVESQRKFVVLSSLAIIRPNQKLIASTYLKYALLNPSFLATAIGKKTGVAIRRIILKNLKQIDVSYPTSIAEQKRIVAKLDQAIEAIDKAKANVERNLQNAKDLFQSSLDNIFTKDVSLDGTHTLNDWCEFIIDCEHKTAPTQSDGYPSIRTPNVGKGKLLLEGVNRVSEKVYNEWTRRAKPETGDLIMAREAPAGNVAIIPPNIKVCLGQRTLLIRPHKNELNSEYLQYLLLTSGVQKSLLSHSTGATVQHVNMKDIRNLNLGDLPNLDSQVMAVIQFRNIIANNNQATSNYQQELNALVELMKSILQKAFNGEL